MSKGSGRHRRPDDPLKKERNGKLIILMVQVAAWTISWFSNQ